MLSFFPRGVLDEILNLIESVSEGFLPYSCILCYIWMMRKVCCVSYCLYQVLGCIYVLWMPIILLCYYIRNGYDNISVTIILHNAVLRQTSFLKIN